MNFKIIVTSDLHGEYGRFQAIGAEINKRKPDLLIDNGDFLQGSPLHAFYDNHPNVHHPMIQLANKLHYDVAVFGNHEFNASLEKVQSIQKQFNFPWISCNIGHFSQPYFVKHINNMKIVVLGVTTQHTLLWDEWNALSSLQFEPAIDATKRWVAHIKAIEQPDFLIVSYHGGFAKDPNGQWMFDDDTGENEALSLLKIEGIDLLITGHQHLCLQGEQSGTHYIQPGSHGHYFAEITVSKSNHCWSIQSDLIAVEDEGPSPLEVEQWLSEEIGFIPFDLTYSNLLDIMVNQHAYVHWFHQFQLETTKAELSVTDLFFKHSGGFNGIIKRKDILANYPQPNKLVVLELTGQAIMEALEQSAAVLSLNKNNEIDYACNVYPNTLQPYLYDFWGGITFHMDLTKPVGNRISNIFVQGEKIGLTNRYTVAMNSFRALGNDPFPMFKHAKKIQESSLTVPELLEQYIRQYYPISPKE
ncbi:MAG: bifunctional metallophosphatase/5'-nucleotidase [Bacillus sp. (in: firmicutes)]